MLIRITDTLFNREICAAYVTGNTVRLHDSVLVQRRLTSVGFKDDNVISTIPAHHILLWHRSAGVYTTSPVLANARFLGWIRLYTVSFFLTSSGRLGS